MLCRLGTLLRSISLRADGVGGEEPAQCSAGSELWARGSGSGSLPPSLQNSFPPSHPTSSSASLLFLSVSYPPSFTGGTDSPRLRLVQHRAGCEPRPRRACPRHAPRRPICSLSHSEMTRTASRSPGRAEPVFDAGRLRPSASRAPRAAPLRRAGHAAHGPAPIARLFRTVQRRPTPAPATPRRLGPASAALHAHAAARRIADGRHTALHTRQVCRRRRPAHRPA